MRGGVDGSSEQLAQELILQRIPTVPLKHRGLTYALDTRVDQPVR